ncbi:hypothetical protein AX16_009702 [Volvariella volvacea WC 439]|nr:hypothetical protein AX16_009702 [Volvariella volvacea WC 439]
MTLLLGLPTEILLRISTSIQEVSPRGAELFYLSQLCKRLNLILIPIILSSNGLSNATQMVDVALTKCPSAHDFDILTALTIAFEIRSLPRLVCRFQSHEFNNIIYHVYRLYLLIARLDALEELELHFVDPSRESTEPRNIQDAQLQRWVDVFGGLNVAVRKGCTRLNITGGMVMTGAYDFWDYHADFHFCHYVLRRAIMDGKTLFRKKPGLQAGPMGVYMRADNRRTIVPTLNSAPPQPLRSPYISPQSLFGKLRLKSHSSSLTSIEIGSCMFLKPPFSQWLYDIFRSSPNLTSVTLKNISGGYGWDWDPAIGVLITCIPRSQPLRSLSIGQLSPSLHLFSLLNLFNFINLSNLTHLYLDETMPSFILPEGLDLPFRLPEIKVIHAPFDFFVTLMHKFDRLESAVIIARFSALVSFGYSRCSAEYAEVLERLVQVRCRSVQLVLRYLPLEFNGGFYDLTQAVSIAPFMNYYDAHMHVVREEELSRRGPIKFYAGVTELVLCSFAVWADRLQLVVQDEDGRGGVRIREDILLYMVAWLSGFVDVRCVEFRSGDLGEGGLVMRAADRFAEVVGERCLEVDRLRIGTKVYELRGRT